MSHLLHVMNWHRGGGGSDNACRQTLRQAAQLGHRVEVFDRDSAQLGKGLRGRGRAFFSGIYAAEGVRSFRRQLEESDPDLVHIHELYPFISPWILPECRKRRIPVVMTMYDFRLTCPVATHFNGRETCHRCLHSGSYWALLNNCRNSLPESLAFSLRHAVAKQWKLFSRHVDEFVVLTEFCRDWLMKHLDIPGSRITVIPCVVDLPERRSLDPSKGEYVFFAGRFVREKGVEELIEACRTIQVPLRLAGKVADHPAIRPSDDIKCLMNRNREELEELYLGARMVVVPSLWYETFGLVAAEASALGLPCIASRLGALQETVIDQHTGILVEPGNVADLAAAIRSLWNAPDQLRILGANGRDRVQRTYSESRVSKLLGKFYSKILGSAP